MFMATRKKRSSGNKAIGYNNRQVTNGYCSDKRLLPRIKQYLSDCPDDGVDVDEMALALQTQYGEYSRKKRVGFRSQVSKVYSSMMSGHEHKLADSDLPSDSWLERRERDHILKRMSKQDNDFYGNNQGSSEGGTSPLPSLLTSSDSEEEMDLEREESKYNLMNNSILQMYSSVSNTPVTSVVVTELSCAQPSDNTAPSLVAKEGSGRMQPSASTDLFSSLEQLSNSISKQTERFTSQSGGLENEPRATIQGRQEVTKTTPTDTTHTPQYNYTTPPIQNIITSGTEPLTNSKLEKCSNDFDGEKLKMKEMHNEISESKAKLKRARRTYKEEGFTAEEGRPTVKRVKKKSDRSEQIAEAAVQEESDKRQRQEFKIQRSAVRFSSVGGCESSIREVCRLLLHLRHPELFSRLGVRPPQGFLLHGPPGCGKTLLANAIAGEMELPLIKLAATEIVSGVSGASEHTIRDLFQLAKEHAPCVLFVDEVDSICPKRETAQREMERRIVTQLLASLDDLNESEVGIQVLVIGATSRPDTLDPALRRSGRFDREICLGIPNLKERESILRVHCTNLCLEEGFSFPQISKQCPGYVGADLVALVREACLCAINRVLEMSPCKEISPCKEMSPRKEMSPCKETCNDGVCAVDKTWPQAQASPHQSGITHLLKIQTPLSDRQLKQIFIGQKDFTEALKTVQPSAKREGFVTVPNTTWADVGALGDIREELSMAILAPVRYPDQFSKLGLISPPGILLAGPPGCGKTLLAKAIANETGINFISVKGPELLNMYVGESERAVRQVFQRARNSSPCVIFFDELDALCPKRSGTGETNASARVVNQLLTEMDGLESRKQVFVMAATNRPDIIDAAVLRPGRLDKILYVGLPGARDREAILKTITKNGKTPQLSSDVVFSTLASDEHCKGFSGADLSALVREAAITALKEHMIITPPSTHQGHLDQAQQGLALDGNSLHSSDPIIVSMCHFKKALLKFRPSVSDKDRLFYQQMAATFRSGMAHGSLSPTQDTS